MEIETLEQKVHEGAAKFTAKQLFSAMGVSFYKQILGLSGKPLKLDDIGYNFFTKNAGYNLGVSQKIVELSIPNYFGKPIKDCFGKKYIISVTKNESGDLYKLIAIKSQK